MDYSNCIPVTPGAIGHGVKVMETIILSQQDVVYGSNNYLKKIFSVDQRAKDCGEISDIWYDCDYIKTKTGQGRGQIEFVDIKLKSKRYVILRNMDEGELEKREYEYNTYSYSGISENQFHLHATREGAEKHAKELGLVVVEYCKNADKECTIKQQKLLN